MGENYDIPFDVRTSEKYGVDRAKAKHIRSSEIEVRFAYPDNASLIDLAELFKRLSESYPDFTLTHFTKEDYDDEDFVCYLEKMDEVDMTLDEVIEYDSKQDYVKEQHRKNDEALARVRIQSYEALLKKD